MCLLLPHVTSSAARVYTVTVLIKFLLPFWRAGRGPSRVDCVGEVTSPRSFFPCIAWGPICPGAHAPSCFMIKLHLFPNKICLSAYFDVLFLQSGIFLIGIQLNQIYENFFSLLLIRSGVFKSICRWFEPPRSIRS